MFSEKDKEIVLYIRGLLSQDGELPEYREKLNTIKLPVNGNSDIYYLFISSHSNVLKIFSFIDTNNDSNHLLKHIMNLNFKLQMGSFCYNTEQNYIMYNLGVPLIERPTKEFIASLIYYTAQTLDKALPEIIPHIREDQNRNKERENPTMH